LIDIFVFGGVSHPINPHRGDDNRRITAVHKSTFLFREMLVSVDPSNSNIGMKG
jgi:hypothetical protein